VCTSAAGMGVDANNVELIAEWRFPLLATFNDLWQGFCQCGRDPKLCELDIGCYEPLTSVGWALVAAMCFKVSGHTIWQPVQILKLSVTKYMPGRNLM
jgi:hypothetical protein